MRVAFSALALSLLAFYLSPVARAQGVITTIAGADFLFQGDGRPAVDAPLGEVTSVAVDADTPLC